MFSGSSLNRGARYSCEPRRQAHHQWRFGKYVEDLGRGHGPPLLELKGHAFYLTTVAFSPDGTRLVTGSLDETLRFWDARIGTLLFVSPSSGSVSGVAFSPDGTQLVRGSTNR